jgi:hypothetical protein
VRVRRQPDTYPARDGDVEIVLSRVADGSETVTVTATGYFSGQPGNPTVRTYELDQDDY